MPRLVEVNILLVCPVVGFRFVLFQFFKFELIQLFILKFWHLTHNHFKDILRVDFSVAEIENRKRSVMLVCKLAKNLTNLLNAVPLARELFVFFQP
mgnify:CR=1 FL=1